MRGKGSTGRVSDTAKILAAMQAITGYLYIAVLVVPPVSNYLAAAGKKY